jgi:hypothetical protein
MVAIQLVYLSGALRREPQLHPSTRSELFQGGIRALAGTLRGNQRIVQVKNDGA